MVLFTVEERERTAQRVAQLLLEDVRIEGVAIVGSLASETADRWSDIDVSAVVADGAEAGPVATDGIARLYEALPVVHHFSVEFGETLVRGFLLEDLLEVDVAFEPAAHFSLWGPARVVSDRSGRLEVAAANPVPWHPESPDWNAHAGIAWHDTLHACIAARRGRPWQALWYLERVRNRALALASQRRGLYSEFFDYVDDLPEEERAFQTTLVTSLEAEDLLRAIEEATIGLLAELRRGEPSLADRLEGPLLEFVRLDR